MSTTFQFFSKDGQILPIEQAVIPLSNIEYSYGFGVYETLKVRHGHLYFVDQHVERLFRSAEIIDLKHPFTKEQVKQYIQELVTKLETDACNIKMLLIGGREPQLFIQALAPLFPDRKLYSNGAKTITVHYERLYPNAKTLNMFPSYMAYRKAKEAECYDALLVNKSGNIIEGTRTNFFAIKVNELHTPPLEEVLEGVTRQTVIEVAKKNGFKLVEGDIPLSKISDYDGAFLTSTSTKIIPINQIDDFIFPEIPGALKELMKLYDKFLDA
jgi:branched-subunit amino acid aminotransferase/4-amino-4-deoxychorismate lyase